MRIGQQERVVAVQRLHDARDLRGGVRARKPCGIGHRLRERLGRPVAPEFVDRIMFDGDERGVLAVERLFELFDLSRRQEPRIVADAHTGLHMLAQPA